MAEIISLLTNSLVLAILLGYIVVLWLALTIWSVMDIFSRSKNWFVRFGTAFLVGFGFFFGFILYLIIRPQSSIEDQKIHALEEKILESQAKAFVCPRCNEVLREDFLFCSNCGLIVKKECPSCNRPLEIVWQQCPFCGVSVSTPVLAEGSTPKLLTSKPNGGFASVFKKIFSSPREPVEIKRGRGRPRKPEPETPLVKRGRGRPRKDETTRVDA